MTYTRENPAPCPYCGEPLRVLRDPDRGSIVTYAHNQYAHCFFNHIAISAVIPAHIDSWNARATVAGAPVCYEVIDGAPVFNSVGQGTRADAAFINKCFQFLMDFWKNNSK